MQSNTSLLVQIVRFGGVGILATLTHLLVLTLLVELAHTPAWLANGMAFCVAVFITYTGQSYFVFNDKQHSTSKSLKFLFVALAGLGLNVAIMYTATNILNFHYYYGFFLATTLIPALTFITNKLWVFTNTK